MVVNIGDERERSRACHRDRRQAPHEPFPRVVYSIIVKRRRTKGNHMQSRLRTIVIKTLHGLEPVLAEEVRALGGRDIETGSRAVTCRGDKLFMYRANRELRTAMRVLVPIHRYTAQDEHALYNGVRDIDWRDWLDLSDTFAVSSVVNSEYFNHSQYVALKTKDAIVDQFRDRTGRRPSVDVEHPGLYVHIHVRGDACTVLLDSSGQPLHMRGYRAIRTEAPLSEVLAAGLVLLSGWDKTGVLLDPMCGSGTILAEAALYALGIAPQVKRGRFAFMAWKNFDPALWDQALRPLVRKRAAPSFRIIGSDSDKDAVATARETIDGLGLTRYVDVKLARFEERGVPAAPATLIMNPPYGERLTIDDAKAFYSMIGGQLKHRYTGCASWILAAKNDALKHIGLKASRKIRLYNGSIECVYQKFETYAGTKGGADTATAPPPA